MRLQVSAPRFLSANRRARGGGAGRGWAEPPVANRLWGRAPGRSTLHRVSLAVSSAGGGGGGGGAANSLNSALSSSRPRGPPAIGSREEGVQAIPVRPLQ